MKAQELRIGNWITVTNKYHPQLKNIPLKVVDIDNDSATVENDEREDIGRFFKFINPIPLTEEWLQDNGFEKRYHDCLKYDYFKYDTKNAHITLQCTRTNFRKWAIHIVDCDFCTIGSGEADYVHQLQNLVLDITGGEI